MNYCKNHKTTQDFSIQFKLLYMLTSDVTDTLYRVKAANMKYQFLNYYYSDTNAYLDF